MSVALRSTQTLRMPRKSVQADLQTPSMRKGSPLAFKFANDGDEVRDVTAFATID
jgi:hypothetical protein